MFTAIASPIVSHLKAIVEHAKMFHFTFSNSHFSPNHKQSTNFCHVICALTAVPGVSPVSAKPRRSALKKK